MAALETPEKTWKNSLKNFVVADKGEVAGREMECYFAEVAAAEQVSSVADAFTELGRQVDAFRRRKPTSSGGGGGGGGGGSGSGSGSSLLDRMLLGTRSGASIGSIRAYARGKSDSALPKDCHWWFRNLNELH